MGRRLTAMVAVGMFFTLLGTGCSTKKKGVGDADGAGLSDDSLSATSLEKYQSGTLGAGGESGPLKDVLFGFDSAELDEMAREALRGNGEWLKENARAKTEIEGHSDERGTVEYNLALGAKRARAAKDYLVTLGVAADRVTTISYGEELPLCREHDESCWARNRRDHFVVLAD